MYGNKTEHKNVQQIWTAELINSHSSTAAAAACTPHCPQMWEEVKVEQKGSRNTRQLTETFSQSMC